MYLLKSIRSKVKKIMFETTVNEKFINEAKEKYYRLAWLSGSFPHC